MPAGSPEYLQQGLEAFSVFAQAAATTPPDVLIRGAVEIGGETVRMIINNTDLMETVVWGAREAGRLLQEGGQERVKQIYDLILEDISVPVVGAGISTTLNRIIWYLRMNKADEMNKDQIDAQIENSRKNIGQEEIDNLYKMNSVWRGITPQGVAVNIAFEWFAEVSKILGGAISMKALDSGVTNEVFANIANGSGFIQSFINVFAWGASGYLVLDGFTPDSVKEFVLEAVAQSANSITRRR